MTYDIMNTKQYVYYNLRNKVKNLNSEKYLYHCFQLL